MRVTLKLVGGGCDGRTVEVDPRDATRVLTAAPYGEGAVALNAETVTDADAMRATRGLWESYERDREDEFLYRLTAPLEFGGGASN